MTVTRSTALKTCGLILVVNLVFAFVAYFILVPLVTPGDVGVAATFPDRLRWNITILVFLTGTVVSTLLVFGALLFHGGDETSQEILDAVTPPVLLLDGNHNYLMLNRAAEGVLNISRSRDIGRKLDTELERNRMPYRPNEVAVDAGKVVYRNGEFYQVVDCPLSGRIETRRHVIILQNVSTYMRLRDAIADLRRIMDDLTSYVDRIAGSANSLSNGATKQASSIAAISTSLNDFSKKIQGNTESAAKGTQLAAQAREAAERSGNEIAHALTAMTDVQEAGIRIARIVKLIDDIAFQTNLLALNAAVEAARAGRQGKGFAVVAEEVRNLAGRSARAAKDTASMVEDVTERIGNASAYISKLEDMLRNIVHDAIRMADSSTIASEISSEQAKTILEVNEELGQMSGFAKSTMANADDTNKAVDQFSREVSALQNKVAALANEFDFSRNPRKAVEQADQPGTINLADDDMNSNFFGNDAFSRRFDGSLSNAPGGSAINSGTGITGNTGSDEDFEAPFRRMAAAQDWDLSNANDDDLDYSLDNLFGNTEPSGKRPSMDFSALDGAASASSESVRDKLSRGPTEFNTTRDGDRVVKPGQNIQLDDSEFGRY